MSRGILNVKKSLDMTGPDYTVIFHIGGKWELSLTGTWTGTVYVLRRFDPMDDWGIVKEYTENIEDSAYFQGGSVAYYMVAVKTAGTGTCVVRCFK